MLLRSALSGMPFWKPRLPPTIARASTSDWSDVELAAGGLGPVGVGIHVSLVGVGVGFELALDVDDVAFGQRYVRIDADARGAIGFLHVDAAGKDGGDGEA